jgi:hypothetical protein
MTTVIIAVAACAALVVIGAAVAIALRLRRSAAARVPRYGARSTLHDSVTLPVSSRPATGRAVVQMDGGILTSLTSREPLSGLSASLAPTGQDCMEV